MSTATQAAALPTSLPSASGAPGVVTAVDTQTVHMVLPQPDLTPDPEATSTLAPALPAGLLYVEGADVLAKVKALGGKGTLVNVWASWCGACKVEMPMLHKVKQRYQAKGIDVLFVSVDEATAAGDVLRVMGERSIPRPGLVAKGSLDYFKRALSPIWQGSLPATFLYDAQGKLRYFWGTQAYESEIVAILDGFLAGEPIDGVANVGILVPPAGGPAHD
jgi:thiol-disulfide isomerase/thioredoxin